MYQAASLLASIRSIGLDFCFYFVVGKGLMITEFTRLSFVIFIFANASLLVFNADLDLIQFHSKIQPK